MAAETCARCGHESGGCSRCDRLDRRLGAFIEDRPYCHLDDYETSCYEQVGRLGFTVWANGDPILGIGD